MTETRARPARKPKSKRGTLHRPTSEQREMVEVLAGYGIPQLKIKDVVGVQIATLHKHYRAELDRGAAVVEAKLVGNLMRIASGSDGTALKAIMFSLNSRFGWSQYAVRPAHERLGKKDQAELDAETAHEGNPWEKILN